MTNILHLGKFYPPDTGGIESVTVSLARGAASNGHQVTVLCFEDRGRGNMQDAGVEVLRVPAPRIASQPLSWAYVRHGLRLARKADVVHVHLPNMLAALTVALIGTGPKVVLHWHSDVINKGLLACITQPLERAMLARADKIICTSQPYADASQPLRPFAGKIAVIPIGVPDIQPSRPASRSALLDSLPSPIREHVHGRPIVLAVGRLVPYKGFSVLIEAAAHMAHDAAIVIVGGGPLDVELRVQADQQRAPRRALIAGRLDDETLTSLKQLADIYCMPSIERSEAFGVALVEALAAGIPAVATQIHGSGVPWVNLDGESGINVSPKDPSALAQALDKLLADKTWHAEVSRGARKRYEQLFTEERAIAQTLALYASVLATPAR